ncbi:TRPT1 [Symbiodinium microadriaticum]|nr:TRPT1 [Symbiodinium microadriaticum]
MCDYDVASLRGARSPDSAPRASKCAEAPVPWVMFWCHDKAFQGNFPRTEDLAEVYGMMPSYLDSITFGKAGAPYISLVASGQRYSDKDVETSQALATSGLAPTRPKDMSWEQAKGPTHFSPNL